MEISGKGKTREQVHAEITAEHETRHAGQEKAENSINQPPSDASSWRDDQQNRNYYYDDAHGYETFNPDDDENDLEPENEKGKTNRK